MRGVFRLWEVPVFLLVVQVSLAQEEQIENTKKNPTARHVEMKAPEHDTSKTQAKTEQRPLPKFDLPEFIITGTASIDLPKLEKIMTDDSADVPRRILKSSEKIPRDRETLELQMNNITEELRPARGRPSRGPPLI